ncbi:MAG: TrmH family RNA methyltransferase [Acidobacteriaceae bacterium]|nr:TrmH family RNA methyltransferase [Acidobacteriaceae bacterium]
MLTSEELDRVCVVLVRARNPNNIGAAARAMHDFGLHHLRVVNDYAVPFESARSAIDASEVLANARVCASVAEAVADCTLVVGTTAVGERDLQHELLPLPDAAPRLRAELHRGVGSNQAANAGRVALLFGSEKTGLSNEELSHCNFLLTVPMQQYEDLRHPSMNLGQAVAVCLYELVRDPSASSLGATPPSGTIPATTHSTMESPISAAERERLTALLGEVLEATEYTRRHPANSDAAQIRRLVRRMAMDASDSPIWMGILRQTLWKLRSSCAD